ncbi:MAG: ThiF family adenylyltransferase [Planctomycetota bacterium]|nr:ThiF family adenylyltransferase [Planctomycetota bacterium]
MEDRFARQTRFGPLGAEGQEALGRSTALIVGCGALGGVVAQWLCRAGVGRLLLVDRDIVEETNLPRQVLFTAAHAAAGTPKAHATAETLAAVGGPTELVPHARHLDGPLLAELASEADLILDGTDNMATRYLVNDHAVATGTPGSYGGVVSGGGIVLPVLPGQQGPCLRCLFRAPPPPGTLPTCDTAGVIGPAVGAVASMEAGLALRILAGREPVEPGLVELDAWNGTARRLAVPRDPGCPCCGDREFPFLEDAEVTEAVSLCGRNTVQVLPPAGAPRPDVDALAENLGRAGTEVLRVGPLARFESDGCRFTLFPDGRTLVEGTDDTGRAQALVARWIGA